MTKKLIDQITEDTGGIDGYVLVNTVHLSSGQPYWIPGDEPQIFPTLEDAAIARQMAVDEHFNPHIHVFRVLNINAKVLARFYEQAAKKLADDSTSSATEKQTIFV